MATYLKPESSSVERRLEVFRAVNEKQGGFDIMFLPEFAQENFRESSRGCPKQPNEKQFIRRWISGGVQPELLVVDPNHCFVDHELIR